MAEVNANVPQAVDPEVIANLTRLLQIRGPLGVLNVLDTIVPVVLIGNVVTPDINIRGPVFRSTDVFSAGAVAVPAAGTVLADTLALPEGIYDVITRYSIRETGLARLTLEHRDAANAANLMVLDFSTGTGVTRSGFEVMEFSYVLALNERFRITNVSVGAAASIYTAAIFARRR